MIRFLKGFIPESWKHRLRAAFRRDADAALNGNSILGALYRPPAYRAHGPWLSLDGQWSGRLDDQGLPLPPREFRMGHADDDAGYLQAGRDSSGFIRSILRREGVLLTAGSSILEWGCAGGRVLRHFAPEAAHAEVWGIDQDGPSIAWCKRNLSPPFKFVTCTAFPHLPFEDNTFTLVYAGSVFTHILHIMDAWVMEFRRILRPGGLALFTVHDEHTWDYLASHEDQKRVVDPDRRTDFGGKLEHDVSFLYAGENWTRVVSFLRSDWIRRDWGQYLEIVSVEPRSESYQTTIVLRKAAVQGSR